MRGGQVSRFWYCCDGFKSYDKTVYVPYFSVWTLFSRFSIGFNYT